MKSLRLLLFVCIVPTIVLAGTGCTRQNAPAAETAAASSSASEPVAARPPAPTRDDDGRVRDLSIDESMGGHTLARHVGRTDAELADRLRREPSISAASTYTDRATAEQTVGAALSSGGRKLAAWQNRNGRRPNLVLNYTDRRNVIGRSLSRGRQTSVPCQQALVVLRWDERADRFYVLTSYPEVER